MKKILLFVAALVVWAACENKPAGAAGSGVGAPDTTAVAQENRQGHPDEPRETNYFPAIDRYLVNVFGKRYAGGEHCVPIHSVVSVDERNSEDILVWGDFWVFNYKIAGDTLKTISGGNHPCRLQISELADSLYVMGYDPVEDGAGNDKSAREIFGKHYDVYQNMHSNEQVREAVRKEQLREYVKQNNLKVSCYQDYGWPAVEL